MSIGCAIKYFRKKCFPMQGGQAEFATALGVTRQEVSAWENGKRTPTLKNLRKIARVLNTTIEQIKSYQEECELIQVSQTENECWRDLAIAYKDKIAKLEIEVKELKLELKEQNQKSKNQTKYVTDIKS